MQNIDRKSELADIKRFINKEGSGFTFLRGRRRVGKTWLLKRVQESTLNCFYFMGLEDSNDQLTRKNFAHSWQEFSNLSFG